MLAHKPIWAFHAEDDSIIPISYARNTIQAIQKAGGQPTFIQSMQVGMDMTMHHGRLLMRRQA